MNTLSRFLSHNHVSRSALAFVLLSLLGITGSALASSGISVSVSTGGISATATVGGVSAMILRVGGPNDFLAETRSDGSSVNWSLPGTAPDGNYRYEVSASAGTTSYRATGRFSVSGGQISEQKLRKSESLPSLWHFAANALNHLGQAVLDVLVPVAEAQDAEIISDAPTAFFDDTSNGTGDDWEILGLAGADGLGLGPIFAFGVFDDNNGTLPVEIDSSPFNDLSIFSDTDGNVSFGNDAVFVDRTNIRLGVGTITPQASVHVLKDDGTAKVFAQDTLVPGNPGVPQTMFELRRPGAVRFDLVDESNGTTWVFQNRLDAFDITKAGTGVQEFKVDGSGNLTVLGNATAASFIMSSDRNLKENFVALEGQEVLARLVTLPVTEWSFKGDPVRHIGPTAQDFKAAFDLGADDKHLTPGDLASVAVVGVQALNRTLQQEIKVQKARISTLEARLAELEATLARVLAERPTHLAVTHSIPH